MKRSSRIALTALMTAALTAPVLLRAQGQATPPANAAAPAAPVAPATGRTAQQIGVDLQAAGMKLSEAIGNGALKTADGRKKAAPVITEQAPKIIALMNEMAAINPQAKEAVAVQTAELKLLQLVVEDPAVTAENAK